MKHESTLKRLPAETHFDTMDSPIGKLYLFATEKALYALLWDVEAKALKPFPIQKWNSHNAHPILSRTKTQLREYFAGKRMRFDIPIKLTGTPFQILSWKQLQRIPYAKTVSYGEQAARLGDKNKARAVGMANGQNPIGIIVPCHRVIGANGKLVGFGGGLEMKQYLLNLETNSTVE